MNLVFKALKFAEEAHHGQKRKMTGHDYITHPIKVSYLLASYKARSKNMDKLLAASLLHDTIEDCNITFNDIEENFDNLVATLVQELTNDNVEIKRVGKLEYIKHKMVSMTNYGLTIKLVDRFANITDLPTQKMIDDTKEIIKHLEENRKLTKTQTKIVQDLKIELNY